MCVRVFRRDVDHSSGIVLSVAALDAHRGARRGRMTRGEKAEILARWETCRNLKLGIGEKCQCEGRAYAGVFAFEN